MTKKETEKIKQNIKEFKEMGFDNLQIDEIWTGLEQGVDILKYVNSKFNCSQMAQIRYGLLSGIDVNKYANQKFSQSQMCQIREDLEDGLNVDEYADPRFTCEQMLKKSLELKKSIQRIHWHKITYRKLTEEEKEVYNFYNYKNSDTMLEGLPDYGKQVLITNRKYIWIDSFDEDENGVYLSETGYKVDDLFAWAEIEAPNFDSLAESGAEKTTT